MQTQPPILDLSQNEETEKFLHHPPLLSSHSAKWLGLYLEFHRLPPLEMPECTTQQHLITIPTQAGFKVEQKFEGKNQTLISYPGSVTIAPMDLHRQYRWDEGIEAIQLSLESELVSNAAPELLNPDQVELIPYSYIHDPLIHQLGISLKIELEKSETESKLYADSAATFLAVHLLRHYTVHKPTRDAHSGGLSRRQLRQTKDYIQEHLGQDIHLDEISNHLGLSRYYFCRLFKQSTGISPYQYVIHCRVERAKQLLKGKQQSLGEIAVACGFTHQSHFHRHFKRLTGITPKRFIDS